MKYNLLFDTDSYKASHYLQYPHGTTCMFDYVEARKSDTYDYTIFFGLQYFIKEYLSRPITIADVEKANKFFKAHGEPFNYDGWMYIAKDLNGKLPIKIRALPEGTKIGLSNALVTVESTDPKVFWVVSWVETALLRTIWFATTVATRSHFIKSIIKEYLNKTSDSPEEIDFKLHNFGSRGTSSQESAIISDMAHLLSFKGTDTVVGVLAAQEYYNADMAGFSIPASEHSSITSWGKENEVEAYRNMLKQFGKPGAIFACVSDSYDIYNAISNLWGDELKNEVIKSGATVVIRPDSGIPHEIVLKCLQLLEEKFGYVLNSKGYKVLNNVRVIQGDGINEDSIQKILQVITAAGYSTTNVAFGMGGTLTQQLNRDTLSFAMKNSSITVDGKLRDVFKDPITDKGKKSKKGRLDVIGAQNGGFQTLNIGADEKHSQSVLRTVFENGEILLDEDFEVLRNRLNKQ